MSFSGIFIQNNQSLSTNQITLNPLTSFNSSIFINSTDKLLTITIDSLDNDEIVFSELVTDPDGGNSIQFYISKDLFFYYKSEFHRKV